MSPVASLALIAGMAVVTFAVRYPVLVFVRQINLPEGMVRALRYVPVAVLLAIAVPAVFMPEDSLAINLQNPYLVAGIVAVVVAWWKKHLLSTIGIGMLVFFVWRLLVVGV